MRIRDYHPEDRPALLETFTAGDIVLGFEISPSSEETLVAEADVEGDFMDEVSLVDNEPAKGDGPKPAAPMPPPALLLAPTRPFPALRRRPCRLRCTC